MNVTIRTMEGAAVVLFVACGDEIMGQPILSDTRFVASKA